MTHFAVLVITQDRPDATAMDEVLWPWCYSNPDTLEPRFDYCEIGGRFEGALDPDWTHEGCKPVRDSSQVRKKDLDLKALQARAVQNEALLYDRIEAALAGRPIPDIAQLVREHGEKGWREHFDADPAVRAVRSVDSLLWREAIVGLADPRDVVLARARRHAMITSAVVSGGSWYSSGLFDLYEDPARTAVWVELSERLLAKAAPGDWLTMVDCHR